MPAKFLISKCLKARKGVSLSKSQAILFIVIIQKLTSEAN